MPQADTFAVNQMGSSPSPLRRRRGLLAMLERLPSEGSSLRTFFIAVTAASRTRVSSVVAISARGPRIPSACATPSTSGRKLPSCVPRLYSTSSAALSSGFSTAVKSSRCGKILTDEESRGVGVLRRATTLPRTFASLANRLAAATCTSISAWPRSSWRSRMSSPWSTVEHKFGREHFESPSQSEDVQLCFFCCTRLLRRSHSFWQRRRAVHPPKSCERAQQSDAKRAVSGSSERFSVTIAVLVPPHRGAQRRTGLFFSCSRFLPRKARTVHPAEARRDLVPRLLALSDLREAARATPLQGWGSAATATRGELTSSGGRVRPPKSAQNCADAL
eukprot:scaffold442_cov268-Pinguiococcus_pyrenoidosus.AAC.59